MMFLDGTIIRVQEANAAKTMILQHDEIAVKHWADLDVLHLPLHSIGSGANRP